MNIKTPKKLIEVALPLDKINAEAALRKRKAPGGYPTTLHKWWAQRPVAVARAVVFAQMVNDPGYQQGGGFRYGVNKEKAAIERDRLFKIIEDLVLWENTNNEAVLQAANAEIWRSWRETCELNKEHPNAAELFNPERLPAFCDPFAGSGAMPLEAQRLGLEIYASDLNPVAVTINKAMVQIPPKFVGRPPVGPVLDRQRQGKLHEEWSGARGLAESVRRYGAWMRAEAESRIGHLYPPIEVTAAMAEDRPDLKPYVGDKLTVIAWLWARTVKSPNPAFSHVDVPLVSTFVLSSKAGKQVYVQPIVNGDSYRFTVKVGEPPDSAGNGTKANGRSSNFICLLSGASGTPISGDYIKAEGQAGRMGARLMAIVAEGSRGRVYLPPTSDHEAIARSGVPTWRPVGEVPARLTGGTCVPYGLTQWGDLFTSRQLVALTCFADLVTEAVARVLADAKKAGWPDDSHSLDAGGSGATAYAQAVGVYLACAVSRLADYGCSLATWRPKDNAMRSGMPKQAIQMSWDYAEGSPLAKSSSGFGGCISVVANVLETALNCASPGVATQSSAASSDALGGGPSSVVVSTDPPYFANIGYADLSDFFYVWLRRSLRSVFPDLFATLAVPKAEELVASPYRHGGKEAAEAFFLDGMGSAIANLAKRSHPAYPVTIYYAYKQAETNDETGTHSTGWETFLQAVLQAGFAITGTWPMRTEGDNRQVGVGNNALASTNSRQRPDIVVLADATCSVVGTESFDAADSSLMRIRDVLIVELKKGKSTIGREEMNQADGYVQDFLGSGALDGTPMFRAFVVGHEIAQKTSREKEIKEEGVLRGRVVATTYGQLTRTAHQRLFRLKDKIPARYEDVSGADLSARVMGTASQAPLSLPAPRTPECGPQEALS